MNTYTYSNIAFISIPLHFQWSSFTAGSLVMEHPGSSPSPIQGKPLLYGTVHGAIGRLPTQTLFSVYTFKMIMWFMGLQFEM